MGNAVYTRQYQYKKLSRQSGIVEPFQGWIFFCRLWNVPSIKLKFYNGRYEPFKRAFDWFTAIPTLMLARQSLSFNHHRLAFMLKIAPQKKFFLPHHRRIINFLHCQNIIQLVNIKRFRYLRGTAEWGSAATHVYPTQQRPRDEQSFVLTLPVNWVDYIWLWGVGVCVMLWTLILWILLCCVNCERSWFINPSPHGSQTLPTPWWRVPAAVKRP